MNLVEDAWIPVLFESGSCGQVSLGEMFSRGNKIADLAVRPHGRIAVMRLLICIAQAALNGPVDKSEWLQCREQIPDKAQGYLSRWRHAFELYGDGQRFLQLPNLEPRSGGEPDTSITKLDVAMATGNNATLFDNEGGTERILQPAETALALLTFQCFSPGGRIGIARWAGKPTGSGSSEHAPCVSRSMLHTYVRGGNLRSTVHLNLLHKQQVRELVDWGSPIWELWPESLEEIKEIKNATETYLGRLVPVSRAIRLSPGSQWILNADALAYPQQRDAASTEVFVEDAEGTRRTVVSASVEKAIWRELSAITVKRSEGGGPLSLQNLSDDEDFEIWTGGLVASKAKLVDSVESVFHIPAAMANVSGQRMYEAGVKLAEGALQKARNGISAYWREFSRTAGKKPNKEGLKEQVSRSMKIAQGVFWTAVEQGVPDLLAAVGSGAESWFNTAWGRRVRSSAREAFEAACPRSTPRQILAFAAAMPCLVREASNDKRNSRSGRKKNG